MRIDRRLIVIAIAGLPIACSERPETTMSSSQSAAQASAVIEPVLTTTAVADDADDPAIWVNRRDPARSLVVATNKVAAPDGALYVFGLDGAVRQIVKPLDRPNNVDVEYGLAAAGGEIDVAVATERLQSRLRVYRIDEGGLTAIDNGGVRVLEGETGEAAMPMGIALYKRPRDGAIFAIVAPKTGGLTNYLWQYRLTWDDATRSVRGTMVRRFGSFGGVGEIEAVAVDDALGYVYYADEESAIHKWHADPEHHDAARELAVFGQQGFSRQREGIAIIARPDGTGFIVCNDQIPNGSVLHVYRREGDPGRPHSHEEIATVATKADSTDGIEISTAPLGPQFPAGLLAMMNSGGRNFQLYDAASLVALIEAGASRRP